MSKGRDFRAPRRRGFDDDMYSPREMRGPPRGFGGGGYPPPDSGGLGVAEGPTIEATVKWFNGDKGFGFAELSDGTGDAFLHIAVLQSAGADAVAPGAKLRVQVGQGQKGRQITRVLEIDESQAQPAAPRRPPMGAGGYGGGGYGGGGGGRAPRPTVDPATAVAMDGTVKWFNAEKGFGFVAADDGGKDVFVHISVLTKAGLATLAEGQPISMRIVETQKGREAVSVAGA